MAGTGPFSMHLRTSDSRSPQHRNCSPPPMHRCGRPRSRWSFSRTRTSITSRVCCPCASGEPFTLYATRRVLDTLASNSIFQVLNPDYVERRELALEGITDLHGPDGSIGLTIETFSVPGKVALFLEDPDKKDFGTSGGDTIGLAIRQNAQAGQPHKTLFYVPGCAAIEDAFKRRISGGGCLMFDGTVFEKR